MADILLSTLVGSDEGFVANSYSTPISVASGVTGDIFVITPPAGERVRLTGLSPSAGQENGVSLTIGSKSFVTAKNLSSSPSVANSFAVGPTSVAGGSGVGLVVSVVGLKDEVFTLSKDTGSTTQTILYAYEFGV